MGQQTGYVAKGACCQGSWPEFDHWDPQSRRKDPTSNSCGLTSMCVPWCAHTNTHTQINIKYWIVKRLPFNFLLYQWKYFELYNMLIFFYFMQIFNILRNTTVWTKEHQDSSFMTLQFPVTPSFVPPLCSMRLWCVLPMWQRIRQSPTFE